MKASKPAVFKIQTYDRFNYPLQQGTGFYIDSLGTGVSNKHVFTNAWSAKIITGTRDTINITHYLAKSDSFDLIVFSTDLANTSTTPFLRMATEELMEGTQVIVIGAPRGFEGTVSEGIISSIRKLDQYGEVIQITAPISKGSSGSPVLNKYGKVLGVATLLVNNGQNINFAMKAERLSQINREKIPLAPFDRSALVPNRNVKFQTGEIMTKDIFLKSIRKSAKSWKWLKEQPDIFYFCLYKNLTANFSDEEIFQLFSNDTDGFDATGDELFSLIRSCYGKLAWTKSLQKNAYKSCLSTVKMNTKFDDINQKKYCTCFTSSFTTHIPFGDVLDKLTLSDESGLYNNRALYFADKQELERIEKRCFEESIK